MASQRLEENVDDADVSSVATTTAATITTSTTTLAATTSLNLDHLAQQRQQQQREVSPAPNVIDVIDLCSSSPPSTSNAVPKNSSDKSEASGSTATMSTAAATASTTATTTLECPICLQTCIHPARLPCNHIFCFLCVKGVAYKNRRCAMCRREIPPEFLDHPQLVNGIDDICTTKATEDGYQWFYEGRNGWWQYDDRTSQDIEEAYKKGEKSCTILVAGYVYIVDLESLLQQRQNEPTRCRRVKRDLATIPKKGVAGLRIEGNTVTTDSNFASQLYQSRQHNSIAGVGSSLELGLPLDYGMRLPANASEFISTIAATDAAVRIASDIIGSTLAHADELSRGGVGVMGNPYAGIDSTLIRGENRNHTSNSNEPTTSSSVLGEAAAVARGSHELLDAAEYLLDATQNVISGADQQTIDLFEQTLNDFHALTLRNIIDSSDEEAEEEDVDGNADADGSHAHRQIRF